jgi:hypothetical protein
MPDLFQTVPASTASLYFCNVVHVIDACRQAVVGIQLSINRSF